MLTLDRLTPLDHSLFVFSSCFTLLINKRLFFHLSTTLYPTDRLTSSASSASSRFLSLARVGLYFEASTKILGSRTCDSERRPLAAAFGSALFVPDVDHPVQCVLCRVFPCFSTCNSERWKLAAAFGSALSVLDVDHPLQCVLSTVLPCFSTCNSERRSLAAAFGSALSATYVDHPAKARAYCAQYSAVFVPTTPNDAHLV